MGSPYIFPGILRHQPPQASGWLIPGVRTHAGRAALGLDRIPDRSTKKD